MKTCKWNERLGWRQVALLGERKGWAVELGHQDENQHGMHPWCVQWGGVGHYFKTRAEAEAYAYGRGGIKKPRTDHSKGEEL